MNALDSADRPDRRADAPAAAGPRARDPERRRAAMAIGLCIALAAAAYANALGNGFAYDDTALVEKNPRVHSFDQVPALFAEPYWPGLYGGEKTSLYRPLTLLTFTVDWTLWNGHPAGFHLTNLLLHALATGLLTLLLLRFAGPWGAGIGGAWFALHPVHTEAVANVVGRAELLAAVAVLGALLIVLRGERDAESRPPAAPAALGASALFAAALLTKESAVVLPLLLLLLDGAREGWTGPRAALRSLLARRRLYGTLALAALAALTLRWVALGAAVGGDTAAAFFPDREPVTRFFTMIRVWPEYVRLLVAPLELSADYSPAVLLPASSVTPLGLLGIALAAALLAIALRLWRRRPLVSAGILWVPIALLPVSNLLFPSGVVLAERTLYLPSVGGALVAAGLTELVRERWPRSRRRLAAAATAALLALFAVVTVRRNPVWHDTLTVFNDVLRRHPESYKVHWALANSLAARGEWREAVERYRTALRIWPHDPRVWIELAAQYIRRQGWPPAEEAARRAVALAPEIPTGHHLLVISLLNQERWADAARAANGGLQAAGEDALLYYLLSQAHERPGRHALAARALRASLGLQAGDWTAWFHVAQLHALAGERAPALAALDSAAARLPPTGGAADAVRRLRDALGPTR